MLRSISIALLVLANAGACAPRITNAATRLLEPTGSALKQLPTGLDRDDSAQETPALEQPDTLSELFPLEAPADAETKQPSSQPANSLESYASQAEFNLSLPGPTPTESMFSKLQALGLRHSSRDGRNAGRGIPLVGTSWLNRPYFVGVDFGTVWVTQPVNDDITRDIDMLGGVYAGCDWDHYWGTELAVERATPELINEVARDADRGDRLMIWTANMLYYPWGDAMVRPYWRCGIGASEIDFPTDDGKRRDAALWAFPIGVGIKYPIRRWLAARAELADEIGLGRDHIATQHDLTLSFALEWRFGAHPRSYWPWNPSRHIW